MPPRLGETGVPRSDPTVLLGWSWSRAACSFSARGRRVDRLPCGVSAPKGANRGADKSALDATRSRAGMRCVGHCPTTLAIHARARPSTELRGSRQHRSIPRSSKDGIRVGRYVARTVDGRFVSSSWAQDPAEAMPAAQPSEAPVSRAVRPRRVSSVLPRASAPEGQLLDHQQLPAHRDRNTHAQKTDHRDPDDQPLQRQCLARE